MIKLNQTSYIAGEWVSPNGMEFQSMNPATGEILQTYKSCGPAETEAAMAAAQDSFAEYRQCDKDQIEKFLNTIADEIESLGDQLLETADAETGLGLVRLTGERGRTCGQIRAFAAIVAEGHWVQASIDTALPDRAPLPKPDLRRMLIPVGPVVVFGASNFPFAFGSVGGDTASALAAGNPVVVKGHPSHPATNELFAHAMDRAINHCGMPSGLFSLLQGSTNELGGDLVRHDITQAVGFTGSLGGGRALMDIAAARPRPIPVYAEMGSINPVFIAEDAMASRAGEIAAGLVASVTMGTGQFCTSPGVVVTTPNTGFDEAVASGMNGAPRGVLLNEKIGQSFAAALNAITSRNDVEWLNPVDPGDTDTLIPPNCVLKTTAAAFVADKALQEEIFGPVTLIVECDDPAAMRKVASSLEGNLTATIHATEKDSAQVSELVKPLENRVGRVIYNGFPTGVEVCPSQQHGGPYPASSASATTSVGADAMVRFARFVAYQDLPDALLPEALQNANPYRLLRRLNGVFNNSGFGA
ncbi:aldehyde dehydrogenase (NADP(+)) [Pseudomonadota bacterium]